jgi:hypothetical protein
MNKQNKTPMTQERASAIQSVVDRTKSPTKGNAAFKARTSTAAAKNSRK